MDESYRLALKRYYANPLYRNLHLSIAPIVLALQAVTLALVPWQSVTLWYIPLIVLAYLAADFIGGFVHMHMDNWRDYDSLAGPLVAVFHLHHVKPRYTDKHPLAVYVIEVGYKNWLAVSLLALLLAQAYGLPAPISFTLALLGVFSAFAEVSHYLCHNADGPLVRAAQRLGLVLDPAHHDRHHKQDNQSYAFLNGVTDPLLDRIAARYYAGYKTTTDVDSGACVSAAEDLR